MSTPQLAAHAAEVQTPASERAPHPGPERSTSPALWGALARFGIPLLALAIILGFVTIAITRWDRWTGQAAVQETDDAYVRTEMTSLASRVAGTVRSIGVTDFQRVKAGDLLAEIDPADYAVQVAQAEAAVAAARTAHDNLDNQIALQRATISQAEAQQASAVALEIQARQERERQEKLAQSGFSTQQKVEQVVADHIKAQSDLRASEAAVDAQRRQLDVQIGTKAQRAADLQSAEATLAAAQLRLGYTRITAPFDGIVGERGVQQGDYVNVGSSLIAITALPKLHVIANYKETQLTRVAEGQAVDIAVDTFPGELLHGYVERLSPASGSQFALLPPDNATGNFTKVVQRIPVRIGFVPGQALLERLRSGMSVTTRIHTEAPGHQGAQP
ncbi:HlyD family secretion protein [Mycobacterium sp. KBS0706]|uniref:HlyD family secretion protein n=1 Tax=Mycobacterium sp. KBS0706 TaxID=2578109 RepID=UPI00110F7F45|nr:HlyD family secretion protein [Mycobacterium sp. KBS0706]TSD86081.1 HlyD family secretion protein [Mycobacterium sp. KBS0706]